MFRKKHNNNDRVARQSTDHFARPAGRYDWLWRTVMFVATFVILFILISPSMGIQTPLPGLDEVFARRDWKSDIAFECEDTELTRQARDRAAAEAPEVHVLNNPETIQNVLNKSKEMLKGIEDTVRSTALNEDEKMTLLEKTQLKDAQLAQLEPETFRQTLKLLVELNPRAGEQLQEEPDTNRTAGPVVSSAAQSTRDVGVEGVSDVEEVHPLTDLKYFPQIRDTTFKVLDDIFKGEIAVESVPEELPTKAKSAAYGRTSRLLDKEFTDDEIDPDTAKLLRTAVFMLVEILLPKPVDAFTKDQALTEESKQEARDKVKPEMRQIRPGQMIIREGEEWTNRAREDLRAWRDARKTLMSTQDAVTASMGNALLLAVAMALLWWVVTRHLATAGASQQNKLILLTLLIVVFEIALARGFFHFGHSGYWVPMASGVILLAILVDTPVAVAVAVFSCVLAGRINLNAYHVFVTLLGGCLAGVLSIRQIRRRSDIVKTGLMVAAASAVLIVAMNLLSSELMLSQGLLLKIGRQVVQGSVNGAMVVAIVMAALPLLESAFKLVTDITLLEYSDLDHPLLQRLLTEAPGTYHHSMVVGLLAQNAADAIGANSVLARVGAYYHDIGKLDKPLYFSENQEGDNKHDELSPTMSSRIVTGHVKEGLALAEEYKLPQPLRDIIVQHHGTNHVSFFYQKAVERSPDRSVSEEGFRYPGPRPQSREAAIVMLADSIESTARSLTNPTPARIRNVADRIINQRFSDGQFDECDLTLRGLHTLADVITQGIVKMQHGRVAYPGTEALAADRPEQKRPIEAVAVKAGSN